MRNKLTFIVFAASLVLSSSKGFTQDPDGKGLKAKANATKYLPEGKTYALIIGVSNYLDKNRIPQLEYAHSDAENFYGLLLKGYTSKKPVASPNIRKFIQEEATYAETTSVILNWLEELISKTVKGDILFVFYSGHGITTKELNSQKYLCYDSKMPDSTLSSLTGAIRLKDIKSRLEDLAAADKGVNVVLVVDACRKSIKDVNQSTLAFNNASQNSDLDGENEFLFFSSANNKFSYESSDLQSGLFSYFLQLGMRGAADEDDNQVSISELSEFVRRNVYDYSRYVLKLPAGQSPEPKYKAEIEHITISSPPVDTVERYKMIYDSVRQLMRSGAAINFNNSFFAAKGLGSQPAKVSTKAKDKFIGGTGERMDDVVLLVDSTEQVLYDKMLESIKKKSLIAPAENCASLYFEGLLKMKANPDLVSLAREKLVAALLREPQKLIDDYLEGTLKETTQDTFYLAYSELSRAIDLVGKRRSLEEVLRPKMFFLRARSLTASPNPHDWKKALNLIDSALRSDPTVSYNYHTKALLFDKNNDYPRAIENYEKAIALSPGWVFPIYALASTYYSIGEYEKSITYARDAIRKDSSYGTVYSLMGLIYENIHMYDSAVYYYKKALATDTTDGYFIFRLGDLSRDLEKRRDYGLDNEESYFRKGYEVGDINCILALGKRKADKSNLDSALYFYQQAYLKDSFDLDSIEDLAYLLANNDKLGSADSLYEAALLRFGSDPRLLNDYARFCFLFHSYKMGDSLFALTKKLNTQHAYYYTHHSSLWEYNGDDKRRALAILHEGLKKTSAKGVLYLELAEFHYRRKNDSLFSAHALDSTIYYYRKALRLQPTYSKILFGLYLAFKEKGQYDSALNYLSRASDQNRYVRYKLGTSEIRSIAANALANNQLDVCIRILRSGFINLEDDDRSVYILANAYYLEGMPDSAIFLVDKINPGAAEREMKGSVAELKALALLDKGAFGEALVIFRDLDENFKRLPDYIGQAVSQYKLGNINEARRLLKLTRANAPNLFLLLKSSGQRKYSAAFINTFNKLLENE